MNKAQSSCPSFMKEHLYERFFNIPHDKIDKAWEKLQLRETFVLGQIPPFRVEFAVPEQSGPFQEGEINIHHGPLLSVHGQIGKISDTYRDLQYFYGSYIISFRFFRPTRLEFFKEENGIRLKIHLYAKPGLIPLWNFVNGIFWKFFGIQFLL